MLYLAIFVSLSAPPLADQAYAAEMLKSLRQTSMVDAPVGAYYTSPTGSFFKNALVEALSVYQAIGGRKGVVLLHGQPPASFEPLARVLGR
jgi:hypothetical protein